MPDDLHAALLVPNSVRRSYRRFIEACRLGECEFRLTPNADASPFALCFAIFGQHLLGEQARLEKSGPVLDERLRTNLRQFRDANPTAIRNKPYRQLLAFTLSALAALGTLADDPLADLVEEQIEPSLAAALASCDALKGRPQSGNQAMFLAVFLIHARDWLNRDVGGALDEWVDLHIRSMDRFGFWVGDHGPTHLHFQNGYHQYEILDYLGIENPKQDQAVAAVGALADPDGHFAPYPGGGGCYDYDAVFVLTPDGRVPDPATEGLLRRTAGTLLDEQNPDGGFCESLRVRPRTARNFACFAGHIRRAVGNSALLLERARYALALQRPRHDRIHTHWSRYDRRWSESNLWDSWFRMLTLARIEVALSPDRAKAWGFIPYPGIGWHPSLRGANSS